MFTDPSSICMVFTVKWWWIKRAGSFWRTSFTLAVELYSPVVFHSLALRIDESLLVFVFMVDHSPSVCFNLNHRKKATFIHFISICWPGFSIFSLLPKLLITKFTFKCILLSVPLKGIQTGIEFTSATYYEELYKQSLIEVMIL